MVLDVDTGIDDALALLYACASPEIELVAVTCVGGNVDARQVAENTRAVLELAGRSDVPVALGREQPLVKRLKTSTETHGPRGIGYAELPPAHKALAADDAATRIIETARSRPGEVTLVTLGPLTNLAVALEREPTLPGLLGGYVLMGGAYRAAGNTTPTSEWNVYVDPHAAKAVFAGWAAGADAAPRPLALGLDVTEQARFVPEHLRHLAIRAGVQPLDGGALGRVPIEAVGSVAENPVLRFIADAVRFYFEFHARYDGFYGAFIHDPFAVAAALDRSLVRAQPVFVDVETGRGLAHGMTVADFRGLKHRQANLDVAVEGDAEAFIERYVERVGKLAAGRSGVAR
ncbi:MAG: nucleoside hydrolase [Chloroflexi bacterium]|nr:MAG: nucleoside hydrolase [Chloroflexota bacterium]